MASLREGGGVEFLEYIWEELRQYSIAQLGFGGRGKLSSYTLLNKTNNDIFHIN